VAYIVSTPKTFKVHESCEPDLNTARQLFQSFHSFGPPGLVRRSCNRLVPKVLVSLGELRGLIYGSDKCQPGRPRTFIHFMETPPQLACDPRGEQLYIIGGKYRITSRGIEG